MSLIRKILDKYQWQPLNKARGAAGSRLVVKASKQRPAPSVGGHAIVHRPDYQEPVTVRIIGAGKHGIKGIDRDGKTHTVRHQHIVDHRPVVDSETRVQLARHAHDRGYVTPATDRLTYTDHRSKPVPQATAWQRSMLESLQAYGVPIRPDGIKGALSAKDAQDLIDAYVDDPAHRITTAK